MAEYMPKWVTTQEACKALDIHPATLRRHVDRNGGELVWGTHWIYRNGTRQSGVNWDLERIAEVRQFTSKPKRGGN